MSSVSGSSAPPSASSSVGHVGGGKFVRKGKGGKRHSKPIGKSGIRNTRLKLIAKRASVKLCRKDVHDIVHELIKNMIETVVSDACIIQNGAGGKIGKKTLSIQSVVYALKRNRRPIIGFGDVF